MVPSLEKELTFPEYFAIASEHWGKFAFDSPVLSYILYIFFGIAILLLLKEIISKIRGDLANKKRTDSEEYKETVDPKTAVKSGQKREDVRFEVLPGRPIRVYLLSEKIDVPVACNCIDFSAGGVLVEFEEPEVGCLEYLLKKERFVREMRLSKAQAQELTIYEILSQPPLDNKRFMKIEKQMQYIEEQADLIYKAKNFISSLSKNDIVEVFFVLPPLPMREGVDKKLLLQNNRTIQCRAVVSLIRKGESFTESQIALSYLKLGYMIKDNIYLYGLETWRLKQQGYKVRES